MHDIFWALDAIPLFAPLARGYTGFESVTGFAKVELKAKVNW